MWLRKLKKWSDVNTFDSYHKYCPYNIYELAVHLFSIEVFSSSDLLLRYSSQDYE